MVDCALNDLLVFVVCVTRLTIESNGVILHAL